MHNQDHQASILQELQILGLKNNPALDYSLPLLMLGQRLSKISQIDEEQIAHIREKMINEILSLSTTLATLKIYDEVDLLRLKFCLCLFLDGLLMQNELFLQSSYVNNTLSLRYFGEPSEGSKFFSIMEKWMQTPLKHKDMLEVIYVCLLLGYQGNLSSQSSNVQEEILRLCENLASSLAPTLQAKDIEAFEIAYHHPEKETFWQKYSSLIVKLILFVVPPVLIACIYLFEFGVLQNSIFKTSALFESQISSYNKSHNQQNKETSKRLNPSQSIKQ